MEKINLGDFNNESIHSAPLEKIGNLIREARINKNQTFQELASSLKISEERLKALEEGRKDLLPEMVFVKAMLKRISEKLQLDTKYILEELNSETKEIKIESVREEVSKNININKKFSLNFYVFILISGIIGLLSSSIMLNLFIETPSNSNNNELRK